MKRLSLVLLISISIAQSAKGQYLWLNIEGGSPHFWQSEQGMVDWATHSYAPSQVGAGLWYRVDSNWSFGADWSWLHTGVEIKWTVPHQTTFSTSALDIHRVGLSGARSWAITPTIDHRLQFGLGLNFNPGGTSVFSTDEWDNFSSHTVTVQTETFHFAVDGSLEYGLDFWPKEYIVLSLYVGARQLITPAPFHQMDITFTERSTDESFHQQSKIRKLLFHAGLGISFPL